MTADLRVIDGYADDDQTTGQTVGSLRHDPDLERVVLGAVMLQPAVRDDVLETGLTPATFYRPAHTLIWETVAHLADTRERIDPTTVGAALAAAGTIGQAGGHAYLHTCLEACSSPWAAKKAAEQLVALATLRALDAAGVKTRQVASQSPLDAVDDAVDQATAALAAVADGRSLGVGDDDLTVAVDETLELLENGGGQVIPTGLEDLDERLNGGLVPGSVTTIGARPGVGKTVIGLQIALHAAVTLGQPVGYTSLEMSRHDLLLRAYANLGSLDYKRLQRSPKDPLTEAEWRAVSRAAEQVRASGLVIPDRASATAAQIRADIRRVQRRRGSCALWVVAYLQLVTPADPRVVREQQIAGIMRALKLTGLSTKVAVVLLAQLSREGEKSGRPPVLTDLRESGSIEQDSDNVLLLHRLLDVGLAGAGPTPDSPLGPDEIAGLLAKHRRGSTGHFVGQFIGHHQRIAPRQWRPSDAAHRHPTR